MTLVFALKAKNLQIFVIVESLIECSDPVDMKNFTGKCLNDRIIKSALRCGNRKSNAFYLQNDQSDWFCNIKNICWNANASIKDQKPKWYVLSSEWSVCNSNISPQNTFLHVRTSLLHSLVAINTVHLCVHGLSYFVFFAWLLIMIVTCMKDEDLVVN